MPVLDNPFDAGDQATLRALQEDPLAMYYVVNKKLVLSTGRAMALGGMLAVKCAAQYRDSEQWAGAFTTWQQRSYRKVALRASEEELGYLHKNLANVGDEHFDPGVICLPPMYKSMRGPVLAGLKPFTDAKRPKEIEPFTSEARLVLTYIVKADVMKSMGKAMAQAGHGGLMAYDMLEKHRLDMETWLEQGAVSVVRIADDTQWEQIKTHTDCVVVRDAGLTQVAPNTETVLVVAPRHASDVLDLPQLV